MLSGTVIKSVPELDLTIYEIYGELRPEELDALQDDHRDSGKPANVIFDLTHGSMHHFTLDDLKASIVKTATEHDHRKGGYIVAVATEDKDRVLLELYRELTEFTPNFEIQMHTAETQIQAIEWLEGELKVKRAVE